MLCLGSINRYAFSVEKRLWRTLSKSSGLVIKANITLSTLDENNRNVKQKHPDTIYESGHLNGGYSLRGKYIEGLVGCSLAQNEYQKRSTGRVHFIAFMVRPFVGMIIYSVNWLYSRLLLPRALFYIIMDPDWSIRNTKLTSAYSTIHSAQTW